MESLIAFMTLFLKLLPLMIAAGEEVFPLISRVTQLWTSGGSPSEADWAELDRLNAKYDSIIQAPIPENPPS